MRFAFTEASEPSSRFRAEGAETIVLPNSRIAKLIALRRHARSFSPHVIHVHGFLGAVLGTLASAGLRTVNVATLHGALEPEDRYTQRAWWYARTAKRLLLSTNAHFAPVSEAIAVDWESRGIPRRRMRVIRNGVATDGMVAVDPEIRATGALDARCFQVGIIGRLVPVKDHRLFLEIAASVARQRSDVRFLIVGDGPLRADLEAYARDLGIGSRVDFLGFQSDVGPVLLGLDLLLFSSRSEGIPYALLEAMALGIPTVAPSVGGLPEILSDGENALLSRERSELELSACTLRILREGHLRRDLSAGALASVSTDFSARKMLESMLGAYRDWLAEFP
jgi:glycosyltransferase involved in cell wall biosynthesis